MTKLSNQQAIIRASQAAGQHVFSAAVKRWKPWLIGAGLFLVIILLATVFSQFRSCSKIPESEQAPGKTITYEEDISYETCQFNSTIADPEARHDCCTNTPRLCSDNNERMRLQSGSGETPQGDDRSWFSRTLEWL